MFPDGFVFRPFMEFFLICIFLFVFFLYSFITAAIAIAYLIYWLFEFTRTYEEISNNLRKLK